MIKTLDTVKKIQLLSTNYIGHLAFISTKWPYVIPITYYYDTKNNCIIGYSGNGHKIEAMRKNNSVSLEVSEIESVNKWKSVLVLGTYEELSGINAKYKLHEFALGVKKIMREKEKRTPAFVNDFSSKLNTPGHPIVFQINVLDINGKLRSF